MKVDDSWWKLMTVDESWWKFLKVDDSWRKLIKVHERWWELMKVDESWWKLMKVYESVWKCIKVYESVWKLMIDNGNTLMKLDESFNSHSPFTAKPRQLSSTLNCARSISRKHQWLFNSHQFSPSFERRITVYRTLVFKLQANFLNCLVESCTCFYWKSIHE